MNSYNSFKIFVAEIFTNIRNIVNVDKKFFDMQAVQDIVKYKCDWDTKDNESKDLLKNLIEQELRQKFCSVKFHFHSAPLTELEKALGVGDCCSFGEIEFIKVPAGSFVMVSSEDEKGRNDNEAQYLIEFEKDFWISKFPVTIKQFRIFKKGHFNWTHWPHSVPDLTNIPVAAVSWNTANDFCKLLNNCLEENRQGFPEGYQFSLPTENEWEYACRAGTETTFAFGDMINASMANCDGRNGYRFEYSNSLYTEVDEFAPNSFGVYDMHGNVWEWCQNNYTSNSGILGKTVRGGSWRCEAADCRSSSRQYRDPDDCFDDVGFRLVLRPKEEIQTVREPERTTTSYSLVSSCHNTPEVQSVWADTMLDRMSEPFW